MLKHNLSFYDLNVRLMEIRKAYDKADLYPHDTSAFSIITEKFNLANSLLNQDDVFIAGSLSPLEVAQLYTKINLLLDCIYKRLVLFAYRNHLQLFDMVGITKPDPMELIDPEAYDPEPNDTTRHICKLQLIADDLKFNEEHGIISMSQPDRFIQCRNYVVKNHWKKIEDVGIHLGIFTGNPKNDLIEKFYAAGFLIDPMSKTALKQASARVGYKLLFRKTGLTIICPYDQVFYHVV
jgi:hypothetical protein